MGLYTRHQLLLILMLVAAAGAGLAIEHWRRAHPDVVERVERLDRVERPAAPVSAPREARRAARDAHPRGRAPRQAIAPADAPLDVNHASAPELARLPGIGPVLATRIVQARPFQAIDDLARVHGLRPATLERVRPRLTVLPLP